MTQFDRRIREFTASLSREPLVNKYLYRTVWTSGCSTDVYPITVWEKEVVLQWASSKRIFDKFIQRIVAANQDLFELGYFSPHDGSCPAEIVFWFRPECRPMACA